MRHLDLQGLAIDGPVATAAIVVPHEYARPYDEAAYGLDRAPAGRYVPAERAWQPDRDVTTLTRAWLNAFVMAARAGVSVTFPRERLDDTWPEVPIVLLPAPLATSASTLHHVRTSFWRGAADHFARGGALWLSCSADAAVPEMDALAGCHLVDRAAIGRPPVLRFVRRWGPFEAGDDLVLAPPDADLATRGAILAAADAEVVAVDTDGHPALLVARRRSGVVVTCWPARRAPAGA